MSQPDGPSTPEQARTPTARYDYTLPPEQIAQDPAPSRSASRALYATRGGAALDDGHFHELPGRLRGDECLVVNDTRVIPARLRARRSTGGAVEVFLLRPEPDGVWRAWLQPARRVRPGEQLAIGDTRVEVLERVASFWRVRVGDLARVEQLGEVPLPPYIQRADGDARLAGLDRERYQTIYARTPGAVAAPTAGLHFTPELLAAIAARDIPVVSVTLHVGPGTFRPITTEHVEDHRVDPELFTVSAEARAALATAHTEGRRLVCVGTTSLRVLETLPELTNGLELHGETSLTVRPGFQFRHVAGLITNFHLPRSSLLMLVASFHGHERTLAAYRHAVATGYRFYSYGDAMVILPEERSC